MIEIQHVSKYFDDIAALKDMTLTIPEGRIFGLLGTNGAGKSTLLRTIAGILRCDEGEIRIDGELCYDAPQVKEKFFYLPDDPYYFPGTGIRGMTEFYKKQYPAMDTEGVYYMAKRLELDTLRPLRTFSKGMKRQAFLIMALCANTKYLLCDEVFDGLDPVAAEVMKDLFDREMKERNLTVAVAAHKLQDLEDICRDIGILHKGGMLMAGDMRAKAGGLHKLQCVFGEGKEEEIEGILKEQMDIVRFRREGYFITLTVRGEQETIQEQIDRNKPVFCKEVPMLLEEVFLAQMEESGYDVGKVFR